MTPDAALQIIVLRLGDNALVLGQRLIELVSRGPELEEELANANFSLDYLGQARMFYSLAGELEGKGRTEDDFAFLRAEREFENFLLVEQPNGHFGDTLVRAVLFDTFYERQLDALTRAGEPRLAGIAARAVREVRYHLRHGSQWLVRLGDGTELSHARVQASLDDLWRFTGEMFAADEADEMVQMHFAGPDLAALRRDWDESIDALLERATLVRPPDRFMQQGGRRGIHSEHFGPLVAEMQYLQRSYPGLRW